MDFDAPWCPACDRLIAPKKLSAPPPPPPPSPHRRPKQHVARKHGLVAGTGRVKPNGALKTSPPLPPVVTRRSTIDQGPTPLYCSDKCHMADINANRRSDAPIDPASEDSPNPAQPTKHTGSIAKLAKMLNFPPLPPPPPTYEEPEADYDGFATEYNSGIMMAGRLLDSFRSPTRKPQNGKYSPPTEERKQIPGWNDGSNAWRSTLYSTASHKPSEVERYKDQPSAYTTCNPSYTKSARPKTTLSPILPTPPPQPSADEMLARYNEPFSRRSESRMSLYASPCSPTSPTSASPTRERSLLPKGAEGKLLVRDVKLKVHSGSSASLSSGWSGPTSASSRRSARSPLSLTSDSSEDPFPGKRPVFETRSWSYDNVDTYPAMEIPVKKVKKIEIQMIDGVPTEVEVEVVEKPKCLFLFAPTTRLSR